MLVAMIPSRPTAPARSATASTSSSLRSGAILTSSGTRSAGDRRRPRGVRRSAAAASRSTACRSAQARGVGRADVDHEVVGVRREQPGRLLVVGERRGLVVLGHHLGLADVHARAPRPADRRDAGPVGARQPAAATASAPSLLKPIRLTTARSSGSRNSRGAGCPAGARRSRCRSRRARSRGRPARRYRRRSCRSRPRAPAACGKVSPIAVTGAPASAGEPRREHRAPARIARNAAWCARSGSARVRTWSNSSR